jgi:hypothetical protein
VLNSDQIALRVGAFDSRRKSAADGLLEFLLGSKNVLFVKNTISNMSVICISKCVSEKVSKGNVPSVAPSEW